MRPAQHTASCKGAAAGRGAVAADGDCRPEARAPATVGDSSAGKGASHDLTRTTSDSSSSGNYEMMGLGSATQSVELVPPASVKHGRLSAISSAPEHSSNRGGGHTPHPAPLRPGPYAEALSDNRASSHSILIDRDGRIASTCSGAISEIL